MEAPKRIWGQERAAMRRGDHNHLIVWEGWLTKGVFAIRLLHHPTALHRHQHQESDSVLQDKGAKHSNFIHGVISRFSKTMMQDLARCGQPCLSGLMTRTHMVGMARDFSPHSRMSASYSV